MIEPTLLGDEEDCTITVIVRLMFENQVIDDSGQLLSQTIFERMVFCWRDAAQQIWNNEWLHPMPPHRWCCYDVRFKVECEFGTAADAAGSWHHVEVTKWRSGGSYVTDPLPGTLDAKAFLDIEDDHNVVAHEIGHVLWLKDEDDQVPPPSAPHHVLYVDPVCLMFTTETTAPIVTEEHIRTIMRKLGVSRRWWCCLVRPFRLWRCLWERLFRPVPIPEPRGPIPGPIPIPPEITDRQLFEMIEDARGPLLAAIGNLVGDERYVKFAILKKELGGHTPRRRWLATIGLGHVDGNHVDEAKSILEALVDAKARRTEDLDIQLAAARGLHRHGSRAGVEALLDTLSSDAFITREPPILARRYADRVLRAISGTAVHFDVHGSESQREAAIARWKAWWSAQPR